MSGNIYDDIDFCLTTLYESIYNYKSGECYNFNTINKKNITIDDIKKTSDFNFTKVLTGNIEKMGIYNNRVHYKIKNSTYPYTIEIGFQNKKYNDNDQKRPELYNMAMMYMCSEIAFEEKFNNFLLPIMCFDIKKNKIEQIIKTLKNDFGEFYESDNDYMYIIIWEHYFKMYKLKEYLDNNLNTITADEIKNILLQIYVILAKLNERFNKFRHNKLNLDSIRLYVKSQNGDDTFKINGNSYVLKDNNVNIKLTDFDYSYNTGEYIINNNPYILLNNLNMYNPYFDVHYITNLLYLYLSSHKKINNIYNILEKMKDFFNDIVPDKYKILNNDIEKYKGLDEEKYMNNSDISISPFSLIKKYLVNL